MNRLLRLLGITLLVLTAGSCTSSVEVDNHRRPVVIDPGVLSGQFANGFSYYLRSANSAFDNDRLELRLVVKAGSIHENLDQRGYAHLVEHMAYRGTKSYSLGKIEALVSDNGLRWGIDVNALTHYGATVYRFSLHRSDEHLLPDVLSLMAEWLDSISFEPLALEKEKRIVSAELRERYAARGYVVDPVTVSAYADSRYENRQPAGDPAKIDAVTADGLRSFWSRTYRPDNAVLIVTGANKPWQFEPMIASAFSGLDARLSVDEAGETEQANNEYSFIDGRSSFDGIKFYQDGTLVELTSSSDPTLALPGLSVNLITRPNSPPLDIAESVVAIQDRFRSQLLFSAFSYLVRDRIANTQACSAIELNASLLESGQAVEKIELSLTEDALLDCLSVAFDAVKKVRKSRVTEEEFFEFQSLFRQITQLSVDQYRSRTASELASGLVDMVANGEVLVSAWDMQKILNEVTSALDLDALNAMISGITESHRLVISAVSNTDQAPSIEAMVASVGEPKQNLPKRVRSTVTHGVLNPVQTELPERDNNYSQELERSIASLLPDELVLRSMPGLSSVVKVRSQGRYHEWQLENGATVILLQDAASDHVSLSAISSGGYARFSGASELAAKSLPEYLAVNGISGFTGRSLRKIMTDHQIYVEPVVEAFHHGIDASGKAQELSAMISMTRGYFAEPLVVEPHSSVFLEHLNVSKARSGWPAPVWQGIADRTLDDKVESDKSMIDRTEKSSISNDLFLNAHNALYGSTQDFGFVFVGMLEPEVLERELHRLIINREVENKKQETSRQDSVVNTVLINHDEKHTDITVVLSCDVVPEFSDLDFNELSEASSTDNLSLWHWEILSEVIAEELRYALREEGGYVYEIDSSVPTSTTYLQKFEFSVQPSDANEVLSIVSDELAQLSFHGVPESKVHGAVARDRRHRMLDASDYKSVSLKAAQRWLAGGEATFEEDIAADLGYLNTLAQCLVEPLRQVWLNPDRDFFIDTDASSRVSGAH